MTRKLIEPQDFTFEAMAWVIIRRRRRGGGQETVVEEELTALYETMGRRISHSSVNCSSCRSSVLVPLDGHGACQEGASFLLDDDETVGVFFAHAFPSFCLRWSHIVMRIDQDMGSKCIHGAASIMTASMLKRPLFSENLLVTDCNDGRFLTRFSFPSWHSHIITKVARELGTNNNWCQMQHYYLDFVWE